MPKAKGDNISKSNRLSKLEKDSVFIERVREEYLTVLQNFSIEAIDETYRDAVTKIIRTFYSDIENMERVEIGGDSIPIVILRESR